jgi:hypothetical protein
MKLNIEGKRKKGRPRRLAGTNENDMRAVGM